MNAAAQRVAEMGSERSQYLTFMLGGEVFAIGAGTIAAIAGWNLASVVAL